MTEGNGHVIDPDGAARRALHEAVAEHGPEALSNAVIMDNVCRDHLAALPGESILIGSAARTDVPALLRNLIPRLGNYGAIQSAAATLAGASELDIPACLWVVREFARALGYIAPGPATGAAETAGSAGRGRRSQFASSGPRGGGPEAWGGRRGGRIPGRPWGGPGRRCWLARWARPPPQGPGGAGGRGCGGAGGAGVRGLTTGGMPGSPPGGPRPGGPRDRGCSTATRWGWPRPSRWSPAIWGSRRWRT